MVGIRKLVIFFAFLVGVCHANYVMRDGEPVDATLVEATIQILRSCYGDRATPVGLAGNAAGTIVKALRSQDLPPVTLIDDTSKIVDHGPINRKTRYKLQVFVVSASSERTLRRTLERVKASVWWNHLAAFLILDSSPSSDDCSNSFEMLWTAWEMDILNVNLMCQHRTKGRLIYTFNPYTSQAPKPWRFESVHKGIKNHPWTLFVQGYRNGQGACNELDYDKTLDLGGYEIRVAVGDVVHRELTNSGGMCFDPIASDTCSIIFPALNATLKLFPHHFADSLGHVDNQGRSYGILEELAKGTIDVGFNGRSYAVTGNLTTSHPYYQIHMHAITQYSGYKSQLAKIYAVLDSDSRFGLYIVVLVTILFFRFFVRPSLPHALLNTLRIICNSTVPGIPTTLAPRIYLTGLFILAVTIQGIFQGRLASLLTTPEPLRNVNTLKDLAELGHNVYGVPGYSIYFGDPAFEGRFHPIKGELCTRYSMKDPKAACVAQQRIITEEAAKSNLHLSTRKLATNHVVLPMRADWPLEQRLNELLMRSVFGDLKRHLNNRAMYRSRLLIKRQEDSYKNEGVKVLTLEQLSFAFAILGIGLGLATVSFVVESIVGRRRQCLQIFRRGIAAIGQFVGHLWAWTATRGK